jgi:hypothetical protein
MYGTCDVSSNSIPSPVSTKMSDDKNLKGIEVLDSKAISDTDSHDVDSPKQLEKAPWWAIFWVSFLNQASNSRGETNLLEGL